MPSPTNPSDARKRACSLLLSQNPTAQAADRFQHYRFGGLKGLRRHGHFKDVRLADPFQQTVLHFPTSLAADNWLVSCFGRSLICTAPTTDLQALAHGRLIKTRCALLLETADGPVADFIARKLDEVTERKWQLFQLIAQAHGMRAQLRTVVDIRGDKQRLGNLERMRQQLVEHVGDERVHRAITHVERFVGTKEVTTIGELCDALAHDLLPRGAVECAAITLYRLGAIDMNISEAVYGAQTTLQLL